MKKLLSLCMAALCLTMSLTSPALAAASGSPQTCYPTSISRSEDGTELKKFYDLTPTADPAGIPRSDFEQDGFRYSMTDMLKQDLPEHESREHTETVVLQSPKKDMESVLSLLPQEREFITEDGFQGTLKLRLDTVKVEAAGYGSSTKEVSATRTYPNLSDQDTQHIPKSIEDDGNALILANINWQADSGDNSGQSARYTAVATYTGTATNSYVKSYNVTADYFGIVSRINMNKIRYVVVFEGSPIQPLGGGAAAVEQFSWSVLLVPFGIVGVVGAGLGAALMMKRRGETESEEDEG